MKAAWAVEGGGIAEAVMKMSFGNQIGFAESQDAVLPNGPAYGMIVAELTEDCDVAMRIGCTVAEPAITYGGETVCIEELYKLNAGVLEDVYPTVTTESAAQIPNLDFGIAMLRLLSELQSRRF